MQENCSEPYDARAVPHYLGHKNIQHTVRYTELSPARFREHITRSRLDAPLPIKLVADVVQTSVGLSVISCQHTMSTPTRRCARAASGHAAAAPPSSVMKSRRFTR